MNSENWSDEMTDDQWIEMMNEMGVNDDDLLKAVRSQVANEIIEEMGDEEKVVDIPEAGITLELTEGAAFVLAQRLAAAWGWGGMLTTLSDLANMVEVVSEKQTGRKLTINFRGVMREAFTEKIEDTYGWEELPRHMARLASVLTLWEIGLLNIDPNEMLYGFVEAVQDDLKGRTQNNEYLDFGGRTPAEVVRDVNDPSSLELVDMLPPYCEQEGVECDVDRLRVDGEYRFEVLCRVMAKSHGITVEEVVKLYEEER